MMRVYFKIKFFLWGALKISLAAHGTLICAGENIPTMALPTTMRVASGVDGTGF
jgi:hypothetical protein